LFQKSIPLNLILDQVGTADPPEGAIQGPDGAWDGRSTGLKALKIMGAQKNFPIGVQAI
tara:strand:+ start:846 stop:1022 length:177 start_codon:yes stop_codon:yes gene_type:complete